jgi:multidrug transporter EmrE-like cation transporter
MKVWSILGIFILFQIIANMLFKTGSLNNKYFIPCFIIANVFGMSSTWILMLVYKSLDANVAMAIGGGATFLIVQLFLMIFFGTKMVLYQWAGIVLVGSGIALVSLGAKIG